MKNKVSTGNGTLAWLMRCINQIDCEDERDLTVSKNPEDKILMDSLNGPIKELEKNFGKKSGGFAKGKVVDAVKTNPLQRQQVQKKETGRTGDQEIEL